MLQTGHMPTHRYLVTPQPKVRMTRRDTWANDKVRPAVQKWRAFAAEVKRLGITVQDGDSITFIVACPPSWSATKKRAHYGTFHRAKPDLDNLLGGLFDAAMPGGDAHIADLRRCVKMWGEHPAIFIEREETSARA
jgi:Holliday junction resolvase RusA-like endonuclease